MSTKNITLISFGYFEQYFLKNIVKNIQQVFNINVELKEGHLDLSDYYNPARRQYDANKLLQEVNSNFSSIDNKTIGLFNVDLFIPIFTFIFGQAYLNNNSGIASIYRLNNERYGIEPDDNLLLERFSKEIIHELGHTFGLTHCHVTDCVMRSVSYVEDIDQKSTNFCPSCRNQL